MSLRCLSRVPSAGSPLVGSKTAVPYDLRADLVKRLLAPGELDAAALQELGWAVVGQDIYAPYWHLPGWKAWRQVPQGAGERAMRLALHVLHLAQRIRVGTTWIKGNEGEVATDRVPASLPPADMIHWLRAAFYSSLREECEIDDPEPGAHRMSPRSLARALDGSGGELDERLPEISAARGFWAGSVGLLTPAPSPCDEAMAAQTAGSVAAMLEPGQQRVAASMLSGGGERAAASRLGVSARTVRRRLREIGQVTERPAPDVSRRRHGRAPWSGPFPERQEGLRGLVRPMTLEEIDDWQAGYRASRYRRISMVGISTPASIRIAA
jgi:hypothetical protein